MKSIGALAVTLFTVVAGFAQASDVDWKLYGANTVGGVSVCFYEANGVVRTPEDHIRVWIKCLPQKDLQSIELGKNSVDKSVEKLRAGYVPPIVVAGKMNFDQIVDITASEEVANTGVVKPQAIIFNELNCSELRIRELSIDVYENGKIVGSRDKPKDWKYILPEGNAANLLKILCHA